MQKIIKEACVDDFSSADYYLENLNKIDRFETCSNLSQGGLTPTLELYKHIKTNGRDIKQIIMIRNKDTFYLESNEDLEILKKQIKEFLDAGARHFIFGYLTSKNKIDIQTCQELINIIKNVENTSWSFHMAIDQVENYDEAFQTLINLNFERVLTKGGNSPAIENVENLIYLKKNYGDQIEILVGGKVTKDNWEEIYNKTKINQFHGTKIA